MKELSIEEKAKRYDEALEKIKNLVSCGLIYEDSAIQVFPEFKESEDEKIRKELLAFVQDRKAKYPNDPKYVNIDAWIDWLENQGEQKATIEMKSAEESLGIDSDTYNKIVDECIFGEQKHTDKSEPTDYNSIDPHFAKPIDKVEPKFKVGDWVVSPNGVYWHIDAIQDGRYHVSSDLGKRTDGSLDANIYHKFTIQDAKDGDVLVNQNGEMPFIFKECKNNHIYCYCGYTNHKDIFFDRFVDSEGEELHWLNLYHEQAYPATKAQRNLLFQKMKKSGYEWDTEKKELKKIEQLPIDVRTTGYWHVENVEQKPAWSEDDERIRHSLIIDLSNAQTDDEKVQNEINKEINWLKSLKERVQLQNRWKPSDEQIYSLKEATNIVGSKYKSCLNSLYSDLKKLKC